jgi:hypothetical protein
MTISKEVFHTESGMNNVFNVHYNVLFIHKNIQDNFVKECIFTKYETRFMCSVEYFSHVWVSMVNCAKQHLSCSCEIPFIIINKYKTFMTLKSGKPLCMPNGI